MPTSEIVLPPGSLQEGELYSRKDIFNVLGIFPHPKGGNWFTGYHSFGGAHFIFCNVGTKGRTGHQYGNHWEGSELLRWSGKTKSTSKQRQIRAMTQGRDPVYLFFRSDNKAQFTYAGRVRAVDIAGARPVQVLWRVLQSGDGRPAEEVLAPESYVEGATTRIAVNAYERNPAARAKCIEHYGYRCVVCGFDFERVYGERGREFIHVHHLIPLASIGERYSVDPIAHLRPVCPNCHAMLHRGNELLNIDDLRQRILDSAREGSPLER